MKIITFIFTVFLAFILNGCIFALGNNTGLCEDDGCNYKEAGVCMDVISIYKNRSKIENYTVTEKWYGTYEDK